MNESTGSRRCKRKGRMAGRNGMRGEGAGLAGSSEGLRW